MAPRIEDLRLLGGALALDFVNTVDWRGRERPDEYLVSYDALVAWARRLAVVSERDAAALRKRARREPGSADGALRRAIELRELLHRVFSSLAGGHQADRHDLELLQRAFARAMAKAHLRPGTAGLEWTWSDEPTAFDRISWAVTRSAVELLLSEDVHRVKRCGAEECGWLFLDRSRNASRRWCSMASCGSRMKMRRQYARRRRAAA